MRTFLLITIAISMCLAAQAHHPDKENQPVHERIDVIGPIGNRLPMSYRRRYNRPSNVAGKISYWIAPSSQEAMAWHRAEHKGYYENKAPRMVTYYFYPKPWEVLRTGARPDRAQQTGTDPQQTDFMPYGQVEDVRAVEVLELPQAESLSEGLIGE